MNDTKKLGNAGELFVVQHLQQQGFTICAQNYRKFFGEVDIIASKKNLYVFVEVKTRKSDFISMGQLIAPSKQTKIIKTAQTFIAEHQLGRNNICRFDVALLIKNGETFSMEYIENAFTKKEDRYGY
ncbi:MAG: YraN family protein [Candidatus Chromulinivorax sp.]|nr:YraN family protein [Candidatus Chromulinivorax sp.]